MHKPAHHLRLLPVVLGAIALVALTAALAACGSDTSNKASASTTADTVVGAGASFPYPLYSKWGQEYAATGGAKLNYQSIGSGGGISAIEAKTVDFGASDAPLEQADLESKGLAQFPMCVGGVVPVVNLDGVKDGQLKLTADVLANIYSGDITTWNDTGIASANPGARLPGTKINVVHRSDGSGTTWIFTHYLTAAAGDIWTAGADKEIAWPVGVGGKGNEGVAASVQQLSGSIGYVEYAYAKQAQLTTVQLQNKDGVFLKPTLESFASAAAKADWKASLPSMNMVLVDQPGKSTWPIVGASFILVQKDQASAARAKTMLGFFDWSYKNGAETATSLDYVAIPSSVHSLIQSDVWSTITAGGTPVWK